MKKILVTLMTVFALMAFTACESKDVEKSEETTTSVAEVTTAATEAKTTTEAETTTEKETEAETEAEVVEDTEIFVGRGYTLVIDGEKWLDGEEYMDIVANLAENTEAAQYANLSADDIRNMGDAIFFNINNGSNFNVAVSDSGYLGVYDDDTLNQLASIMKEQYNKITGYNCEEYELVEVNGYKALKFTVMAENDVNTLKMNSYIFYKGTNQIVVTYTVAASKFDDTIAEFEKVLNTIELTETAADDNSAKPESTGTADANSYSSNDFNFEYDSSKWAQDETDSEVFNYISSNDIWESASNFNIKQDDMGMDMDMSAEMMEIFALSVKEEYDNTDGVTFLDWSAYSKKDDVLLINSEAEYMGIKMKVQQYCFMKSGKMSILTFTATNDCFDAMIPEFEAVVNTAYYE